MKKIALFMLVALVCVSAYILLDDSEEVDAASDDSGSCGGGSTYIFDSSSGTLTISGYGPMDNYGSSVYSIDKSPWYSYRGSIKSVQICDSVKSVGKYAFYGCTYLTSVNLSDSVTTIGQGAFEKCSTLTTVTIPKSITEIGHSAFKDCILLKEINYNAVLCEGNRYSTSPSFENAGTSADAMTIVFGDSVTVVPKYHFINSGVTSVTFSNSITAIEEGAFVNCTSLVSADISNSVTTIKKGAFEGCTALTSVVIPESVTDMGNCVFSGCTALTEVIFNAKSCKDYSSSYSEVFSNAGIYGKGISVLFGDSVTKIPNYLLGVSDSDDAPNIISISFGKSLTSLGNYSLGKNKLYATDGTTVIWTYGGAVGATSAKTLQNNTFQGTNGKLVMAEKYKMIFDTGDESVYSKAIEGETVYSYLPNKTGYKFLYWTDDGVNEYVFPATMPAYDVILTAVWEIKKYNVTFNVNGDLTTATYDYGTSAKDIAAPADPTKEADSEYSYIFTGWDGYTENMTVAGDTEFKALFAKKAVSGSAYSIVSENDTVRVSHTVVDSMKGTAGSDANGVFKVTVGKSCIVFDSVALRSLISADAELGAHKLSDEEKTAMKDMVGDSPVYRITFGSNTDFGEGKVTVTVPYTLKDGQDQNNLKIWYINGNDHTEMPCTYESGSVSFETNHFSDYAVMYIEPEEEFPMMFILLIVVVVIAAVAGIMVVKKRRAA